MTDITTIAPVAVHRSDEKPPGLRIGACFADMFATFGDALKLTYVDPYAGRRRRVAREEGQDGRDPDW
jgi:hypothetical protein